MPNGVYTLKASVLDFSVEVASNTVQVTVSNATAPPPPPPPPPPPSGLVAAYGFEEVSGTQATDSSGSGRTGTISGATRSTAGKFGSALSFDGVNDLVTVADANALDLATGMTLEAWVKPTALGTTWRTVVLKERPSGLVYGLYAGTDTSRPSGNAFTSAEFEARGPAQLALNAWSHLAATYDGANVRLYVNGALVSSQPATGAMGASTGALRVGGNTVWAEWFKGLIDEVRVYDRALSGPEIQADSTRAVVGG